MCSEDVNTWWMNGVTGEDIRNEYIKDSVPSIVKKMKETRLRWFGHVMRREESETVRMVMTKNIIEKRGKGIRKIRLLDVIENDMMMAGVYENDVRDRVK